MPTNLYGPKDNFHPLNSHILPALIRRFHEAKILGKDTVEVWGSGRAKREFLYVEDMAKACVFIMNLSKSKLGDFINPMQSHINIGTGVDVSIADLAEIIKSTIGYSGNIIFDDTKPEGSPKKLLNIDKLSSLGFRNKIDLRQGVELTYDWFKKNIDNFRS